MINTSEATMLPFLKKSYRYDPIKDFTPIALVVTSWTVFAVNPKVPANTLPELVAYSKSHPAACATARAAPAACCTSRSRCSSSRAAATSCMCRIAAARRPRPTRSPGQIEMVSMGLASTRVADSGQLQILAQTGPSRHPMLPDVPTTAEAGLPDVRMDTWFGLVGPPGMPKEIVARINRELAVIVKQPAFQDKLAKLGLAVDFKPDAEFISFMADDTKKWRELIPAMGIPQVD